MEEVLQALDLPADWLDDRLMRHLSEKEREAVKSLGGLQALMDALRGQIRGAAQGPSLRIPQAGHFVQEHGQDIAAQAVEFFTPPVGYSVP